MIILLVFSGEQNLDVLIQDHLQKQDHVHQDHLQPRTEEIIFRHNHTLKKHHRKKFYHAPRNKALSNTTSDIDVPLQKDFLFKSSEDSTAGIRSSGLNRWNDLNPIHSPSKYNITRTQSNRQIPKLIANSLSDERNIFLKDRGTNVSF